MFQDANKIQTFEQFCWHIIKKILNFSPAIISRTVESMNKRVDDIIALKGERINYQGDYFH